MYNLAYNINIMHINVLNMIETNLNDTSMLICLGKMSKSFSFLSPVPHSTTGTDVTSLPVYVRLRPI